MRVCVCNRFKLSNASTFSFFLFLFAALDFAVEKFVLFARPGNYKQIINLDAKGKRKMFY